METVNQARDLEERLHAMEGLESSGAEIAKKRKFEDELAGLRARVNDIHGSLASVIACMSAGGIAISCTSFLQVLKDHECI